MPEDVLGLTAQIVSAHVTKNAVSVEDLPGLIREVYKTLSSVGEVAAPVEAAKPAGGFAHGALPCCRDVDGGVDECADAGASAADL